MEEKRGEDKNKHSADFEEAISATGFGKFNLLLMIIALPSCFATVYETSTMSYILPSAECDLKLTLIDKGILNAITYAGMISSAIFWGFMADTKGRRLLLVFGYLLDGVCAILGSLSQNVYTLMTFKYLGGFLVCGPFAVLMSYVTEFHGVKHRAQIMMIIGMFFSMATLLLPVIAWGILPQQLNLIIFENKFVIHSWQIFLAICAIPSILSGFSIIFMPESPKFLMSQGKNDEALKVFQLIYSINMKQPKENYPIKTLIAETTSQNKSTNKTDLDCIQEESNQKERLSMLQTLQAGLKQLKPMFSKPYLCHSIHVYTIQFCILLGLNTVRLWLPQLFSSIAEFEQKHLGNSDSAANLCAMIAYGVNKSKVNTELPMESCEVAVADEMYMNTVIVGISGLLGYFIAGALINALGNKGILIIALSISGLCGITMFWATNSLMTLILSSIYVTVGSIASTALLGVIVSLFPTTLRTMIVSLSMMFGRLGALIGNILFPFFMSLGCFPPFFMIGCVMIISAGLCCLLPKTHKIALK